MPWDDSELIAETMLIAEKLACINCRGVLTINSQPRINCAPSEDPSVGWGIPHGYIFQKVSVIPIKFPESWCSTQSFLKAGVVCIQKGSLVTFHFEME